LAEAYCKFICFSGTSTQEA